MSNASQYITEEQLKQDVFKCASMDVFSKSFSPKKSHVKITQEEIDARKDYNDTRRRLRKMSHRTEWDSKVVTEVSQFLSSVMVPPALSFDPKTTSKRTKATEGRSKRRYAPGLSQWHIGLIHGTEDGTEPLKETPENLLSTTLGCVGECRDEGDEQSFLRGYLWGNFREAGLMFAGEVATGLTVIGLPDDRDLSQDGENVTIMIEVKATHNLLLPNDFTDLQKDYEDSFNDQNTKQTKFRPTKWCHVCHPLAQLFAYMIDNNVRFGVLCSASKAYFCFFEGTGNEIDQVRVSSARLTVSQNYLKNWAWFIKEARKEEYKVPSDGFKIRDLCEKNSWLDQTPILEDAKLPAAAAVAVLGPSHPNKRDRDSNGGGPGSGFPGQPARKQRKTYATRSTANTASDKKKPSQGNGDSKRSRKSNAENRSAKANSNVIDSSPSSVESEASMSPSMTDAEDKYEFEIDFMRQTKTPFIIGPSRIGKVLGRGRNG